MPGLACQWRAVAEPNRKTDTMVLPVTGNGGGEGSLDPID